MKRLERDKYIMSRRNTVSAPCRVAFNDGQLHQLLSSLLKEADSLMGRMSMVVVRELDTVFPVTAVKVAH